jgi:hypothetical protein
LHLLATKALSLIHTLCISLQHVLSLLSLLCLHQPSYGNGCQHRAFSFFRVPNYPLPQLPASNSNSSRLNLSSHLTHNQHLGKDRTENTVPVLVFNCCLADRVENITPLLSADSCLARTAVQSPISRSPPSNGSTCHNTATTVIQKIIDCQPSKCGD